MNNVVFPYCDLFVEIVTMKVALHRNSRVLNKRHNDHFFTTHERISLRLEWF